jgi:hypothetical protein
VPGQFLLSVYAAFGRPQDLDRHRTEPLILKQSLMGGGVIRLDEGLLHLLQPAGVRVEAD